MLEATGALMFARVSFPYAKINEPAAKVTSRATGDLVTTAQVLF